MQQIKMNKVSLKPAETINFVLREHQSNAHDWRFSNLAAGLHIWAERMILYFKIQSQAIPALMVERLRKRPGHYRSGRNCFGINDEIAIDENHAQTCPYWHVLGTLAHEILHFWQQHNGNPPSVGRSNYHNKQYRQNAREIGLVVDPAGHTQYVQGDSPFIRLLKKYGVEFPPLLTFEGSLIRKCTSALRLYRCSCGINVRIGRPQFNARCLDCGTLFIEQKG